MPLVKYLCLLLSWALQRDSGKQMITRGARIMAMAAFASTRCCSFLHGGTKAIRTGSRGCVHVAALHVGATPHVQRIPGTHDGANGRANADEISLDATLISKNPDLVLGHLQARRVGQESTDAVQRIGGIV